MALQSWLLIVHLMVGTMTVPTVASQEECRALYFRIKDKLKTARGYECIFYVAGGTR